MTSAGPTAPDRSSQAIRPAAVLNECCAQAVACQLHLLHSGQVIDASFHLTTGSRTILLVAGSQHYEALQPDALCCVAFPFQHLMCAFLACVKVVRAGANAIEVHFEQPPTLMMTNLRNSYRVPVVRDTDVEVSVRLKDGTRICGEVSNISDSGMELNLPCDDPRLLIDVEVHCELKFREDYIDLPAIVRRRDGSRRGLQFLLVRTPESRQKVLTLQRIVRSLEQVWLKSRLT